MWRQIVPMSFALGMTLIPPQTLPTTPSSYCWLKEESSSQPDFLVWLIPLITFRISTHSIAFQPTTVALLAKQSAFSLSFTHASPGTIMNVTHYSHDPIHCLHTLIYLVLAVVVITTQKVCFGVLGLTRNKTWKTCIWNTKNTTYTGLHPQNIKKKCMW